MKYILLFLFLSYFTLSQYITEQEIANLPYLDDFYKTNHLISSYDRKGGNADDEGYIKIGERSYELLEVYGTGSIDRIWFTNKHLNDTLIFHFEDKVDTIPVYDIYYDVEPNFVFPLSYNYLNGSGGHFTYGKIFFNNYLKVEALIAQPRKFYYEINYTKYWNGKHNMPNGLFGAEKSFIERFDKRKVDFLENMSQGQLKFENSLTLPGSSSTFSYGGDNENYISKIRIKADEIKIAEVNPRILDWGRVIGESSSFTVEFLPNNEGGMLTRRMDPKTRDQFADVFINGEYSGSFSGQPYNYNYRYADDTLIIDKKFIQEGGKYNFSVRNQENERFDEFNYRVLSLINGEYILSDSLDVGNIWTSEPEHSYEHFGQVWTGATLHSYKPVFHEHKELNSEILSKVFIKVFYDTLKKPSINAPIGLFFGISTYEAENTFNYINGVDDDGYLYFNLPIIYRDNCKIVIENNSNLALNLDLEIRVGSNNKENFLYLNTSYREEVSDFFDRDYNFAKTDKMGKYIGEIYESEVTQAFDDGYLEGDLRYHIDNMRYPIHHGPGAEDHFNGAFYYAGGPYRSPFSGSIYTDSLRRTQFRYRVLDPVPFFNGGRFGIEHGTNNTSVAQLRSLAWFYTHPNKKYNLVDSLNLSNNENKSRLNYNNDMLINIENIYSFYPNERAFEVINKDVSYTDGPIKFEFDVNPLYEDKSINDFILYRSFDNGTLKQKADLYVNGEYKGIWFQESYNEFQRFAEDFFILPNIEKPDNGKLEIEIDPSPYSSTWSEISYKLSYLGENPISLSNDNIETSEFLIYPNPNEGIIKINIDSKFKGFANVRIINQEGRIYKLGSYAITALKSKGVIIPKTLKNGVYIIEIDFGEKQLRNKFILQR